MDYCNYGPPCKSCPAGHFCPMKSPAPAPCAAGSFNPNADSASASDCRQCPANSYCLQASSQPTPCPTGTSSAAGSQSIDCCRLASPVTYACSWSQAALSAPRSAAASASLPPRDAFPSGLVLFAGGADASTGACSAAVDIFDPQAKAWSTAVLASPRCAVASAALPLQVNHSFPLHFCFKTPISHVATVGRRYHPLRRRFADRPVPLQHRRRVPRAGCIVDIRVSAVPRSCCRRRRFAPPSACPLCWRPRQLGHLMRSAHLQRAVVLVGLSVSVPQPPISSRSRPPSPSHRHVRRRKRRHVDFCYS